MKLNDGQMVRMGQGIIAAGIIAFLLPFGEYAALAGLILIGLGCAPIYPSIIHATPDHFGADKSQAFIGVQMASAYAGTCFMPPLFGMIANHITIILFPLPVSDFECNDTHARDAVEMQRERSLRCLLSFGFLTQSGF